MLEVKGKAVANQVNAIVRIITRKLRGVMKLGKYTVSFFMQRER